MVNIPRWQIVLVIVICVAGVAFAAPNLFSRQFAETIAVLLLATVEPSTRLDKMTEFMECRLVKPFW